MTTDQALTLTKGDRVQWTWRINPAEPLLDGKVLAVNERAVSILWANPGIVPSVYFFDDEDVWLKIEPTPEEPHYEPIKIPITFRRMHKARGL